MLGFNQSSEYEKVISKEQKRFDKRFIISISLFVLLAISLIVADMNYLKVGFLVPIGFAIGLSAIAANLVKGHFDWRRKKSLEESGELSKRISSKDVEVSAAKVSSMKPPKTSRKESMDVNPNKYSNDALDSPIQDVEALATTDDSAPDHAPMIVTFSVADPFITDFAIEQNSKAESLNNIPSADK